MMLKAPTTPDSPSFDLIDEALRRAPVAVDAAEAHGSLCGLLCGLGASGQSTWLAETLADNLANNLADNLADNPVANGSAAPPNSLVMEQTGALLKALAASTQAALEGVEMTFQPLLPEDDLPLADRVDGLAQWCQGFNHGLFVAARIGDAEAELGSGNTVEIVRDFGEMAQVAVGDDEADADGEAAYAELVEYVRISVQLVYEELADVRQRVQSAGRH